MNPRTLALLCGFLLSGDLVAQEVELVVPTGHTREIMRLVISPGGGLLASSSIDETVKIFETGSGRELHTFRPGDMARDIAFSHDGRYLAVAAFNTIHILDLSNFTTVREIKGWNTNGVRFHSEKNELYFITQKHNSTGDDPQQLRKTTIPTGEEQTIATFELGKERGIASLDYFPGRQELLIVLPGEIAHRVSIDGENITGANGARGYTPDGRLFCLRKSGGNVTMSVENPDGTRQWELPTTAAEVENFNTPVSAGFHEGNLFWVNRKDRIASGDFRTGKLAMTEMPEGTANYALTVGPDGSLYTGTKSSEIHRYKLPSLTKPEVLGEKVLTPALLLGAEEGQRLTWGLGEMSSLRIDRRHVLRDNYQGSFNAIGGSTSTNGRLLASRSNLKDLFTYLVPTRHSEVKRFKTGMNHVKSVSASRDGDRLLVVAQDGFLVLDTETDKAVKKAVRPGGIERFEEHSAISPDGTKVLISVVRKIDATSNHTKTGNQLIELSSGTVLWEKETQLESPAFTPEGDRIIGEIFENFVTVDATTGEVLEKHPLPDGRFPSGSIANSATTFYAYTHDFRAYLYNLKEKKEDRLIVPGHPDLRFDSSAFFGDDFVAFAGREAEVRIFDLRTLTYVASLVQYARSEDWAIIAPDGRFDATPGAMKKMYYRVGQQLVALEQLFEGFYTPGLAGAIFGRLPLGVAPPPYNISDLSPPPKIEAEFKEGGQRGLVVEDDVPEQTFTVTKSATATVILKGEAPGGKITELRLYQNGKLLGDATRGLVVEDDPEPVGNTRSLPVRLQPGLNEFKAVALNHQRTESPPVRLLVKYEGAGNQPAAPGDEPDAPIVNTGAREVSLHIVTIGINEYANQTYNLNYATADANGVEEGLRIATETLVGKNDLIRIRNDEARRETILAKLSEVVKVAGPEDLFVFYYAGHGVVPGGEDRNFYLVPYDVTDIYGEEGSVSARGISAAEIQRTAAAIPAERQLYILDACQSAGALDSLHLRGAAEDKAIAQIARTTGTHWLTASASDQFASEFDELGHGAFTYVLLEAMKGKAAFGDGFVTVEELKRYLATEVPRMTEEHTGQAQYPANFGFGKDFNISRLKE
ncbi:caspase family protein [Verrucomicrobiales bacterium BCK34]|nr:caspase family protein [Verrucomicrobiales bacterium BCK34]